MGLALDEFLKGAMSECAEVMENASVTIAGTAYPAIYNTETRGGDLAPGAFDEDDDRCLLVIRRSLFTGDLPADGGTAVMDGTTWRIVGVRRGNVAVELELASKRKRRG